MATKKHSEKTEPKRAEARENKMAPAMIKRMEKSERAQMPARKSAARGR
jgi:hypothetical protein